MIIRLNAPKEWNGVFGQSKEKRQRKEVIKGLQSLRKGVATSELCHGDLDLVFLTILYLSNCTASGLVTFLWGGEHCFLRTFLL